MHFLVDRVQDFGTIHGDPRDVGGRRNFDIFETQERIPLCLVLTKIRNYGAHDKCRADRDRQPRIVAGSICGMGVQGVREA